jgi:hypothetical protein
VLSFLARAFGPSLATAAGMILMIWNSDRAKECARSIEDAMQEAVQVAFSLQQGMERCGQENIRRS